MPQLLALSIGPVQSLIAAARRTRDLWFGSYLLSEISKAAALAVQQAGGKLIFPAPDADLKPDSDLNVANVILAELPDGPPAIDARKVAANAKDAARLRWQNFADVAFAKHQDAIDKTRWDEQIASDVIEFFSAWVPLAADYTASRDRVMRLIGGRKQCANFDSARGAAGVPKSSLDGMRESVLNVNASGSDRRKLHLGDGEQLDALGVIKRVGAGNQPFPSVARIAADPWIRGAQSTPKKFEELTAACGQVSGISQPDTGRYPQFKAFPFEATILFPSRHAELIEELGDKKDDRMPAVKDALRSLGSEPEPYLAILVADGDGVGKCISSVTEAETHRKFTKTLAAFSAGAKKTISEFQGAAIYCGGDDVLALLPVDKCLACAAKLRTDFASAFPASAFPASGANCRLTLSVGIAIGHFMEPLEDLLEYGRSAERHAKVCTPADRGQKDRNALAVHLHKRGGAPVKLRANWKDAGMDRSSPQLSPTTCAGEPLANLDAGMDRTLADLAQFISDGRFSNRIVADMENVARLHENWPEAQKNQQDQLAAAIRADFMRVAAAKAVTSKEAVDRLREIVRTTVTDSASLRRLAAEILVARQLAAAVRQAQPQSAYQKKGPHEHTD